MKPTPEFIAKYGNPDADGDGILDPKWFTQNIRVFTLPFPMVQSWGGSEAAPVTRFQAHRFAGDRIVAALTKMLALATVQAQVDDGSPPVLEWMRKNEYDVWGGCFNFRNIRGGTDLSKHAWGAAVDICPARGAMGDENDKKFYPDWIVAAFKTEGFEWGGDFTDRVDAMHFEV